MPKLAFNKLAKTGMNFGSPKNLLDDIKMSESDRDPVETNGEFADAAEEAKVIEGSGREGRNNSF